MKQLHIEEKKVLWLPGREETCCGVRAEADSLALSSQVSLFGNEKDLCVFAMAQAANALATRGAHVAGVELQIMLPEFAYESRIKAMTDLAAEAAFEWHLPIMKADAQVVPGIQTTIVHANALGTVREEKLVRSNMASPGQDIVLVGHVGLEGSLRVKREKEAELKQRFVPAFLHKLEACRKEIYAVSAIETAAAMSVSAMHQIAEGGILAALWELAEGAGLGLSVDMRKIAVKQETIEVCEYFHLNPYQLTSTGCILMVTDNGDELADTLNRNGINTVWIGRTTDKTERGLINGEEKRYLDRPAQDELVKFLSECMKEKSSDSEER